MQQILNKLAGNKYLPLVDDPKVLPDGTGAYVICARDIHSLPDSMHSLEYMFFDDQPVIYTGIAGTQSLRKRDYRNHFNGNARGSTLRKSLGVLFGLTKEQRPRETGTNKFLFTKEHESYLSNWMKNNLILYYYESEHPHEIENKFIDYFHPPLNIKDNRSKVNLPFRVTLSELRKYK